MSQIEAALSPLLRAFQADGYATEIVESAGKATIRIVPTQDACEDCLSPRAVIQPMIDSLLRQNGLEVKVELKYPNEL